MLLFILAVGMYVKNKSMLGLSLTRWWAWKKTVKTRLKIARILRVDYTTKRHFSSTSFLLTPSQKSEEQLGPRTTGNEDQEP